MPIQIGRIKEKLSDTIPFTILSPPANSDSPDETLLSGPLDGDAPLMTKKGVEKTTGAWAISTITGLDSTIQPSDFCVGFSENGPDSVHLTDLAIRVQVGGQALIDWIKSQYPSQNMNQTSLDESIGDLSNRLEQVYKDSFKDHPMLRYAVSRFPKLCSAYKVIIYPELTGNHYYYIN